MNRKDFIRSLIALGIMGSIKPIKALNETLKEDGLLMPVLFIGHGSPMNAIETNEFTGVWKKLEKEIPQPKAVLCISAHWLTRGTAITAMESPRTIHDFGGFPQTLFDVQYPAPGNPALAKETQKLITSTNVGLDHDWGLDHGTWSVVKQMYPGANIPVLQLSIDYYKSPQYHYDLSKQLYELRKKGVLIIGSGNMVHNLPAIDPSRGLSANKDGTYTNYGFDWAIEFNEKLKEYLNSGNHQGIIDYQKLGRIAKLAHPTPDHYYPLLYTLGVVSNKEEMNLFNDKYMAGSLSMTSVKFG